MYLGYLKKLPNELWSVWDLRVIQKYRFLKKAYPNHLITFTRDVDKAHFFAKEEK